MANDHLLRKLDCKANGSTEYSLVIAVEAETMRGVDYRAPQVGIMLLIGKSFANAREAGQGLARVGRLTDKCLRIAIEGIPLVDPEQEGFYQAKQLEFCRQMNNDAGKVKALPEFKQPEPAKK